MNRFTAIVAIVALALGLAGVQPVVSLPPAPATARVQTVTFQQGVNGYTGNSNAFIDAWAPTANNESPIAAMSLRPGSVHSLVRFDLATLPSDAYVHAATLRLHVLDRTNASGVTLRLFRMLRPWSVRQVTWNQPAAGEDWGRVGVGDVYLDRVAVASASAPLSASAQYCDVDVTALVRHWVRNSEDNYGALLVADAGVSVRYRLKAASWPTVDQRPRLTITYSVAADNDFAPTVRWLNPLHQSFVRGAQLPLQVDVRDDTGIARVEYELDGAPLAVATTPPYSVPWNTQTAGLGTHRLTARVYDSAGQMAEASILVHVYRMEQGVLTIAHISDTHIGKSDAYAARFQQAIQEINTIINPAVIVHTGDIMDAGSAANAQLYNRLAATSSIPIWPIPGNHDLNDPGLYQLMIGPLRTWLDVGPHRLVGLTDVQGNQAWAAARLAATSNKGIIFGHVPLRLPQGSNLDPGYYAMTAAQRAALQSLMSTYGVQAYLSGHLHQYFTYEDISRAAAIGASSLGMWGSYNIVTSDAGVISSVSHVLGQWPEVVITRPQPFYRDGGTHQVRGSIMIAAKVFGDARITAVAFAIDNGPFSALNHVGNNVWRIIWDSGSVTPGVHSVTVRATDARGRSRQSTIQVNVAPSQPTLSSESTSGED